MKKKGPKEWVSPKGLLKNLNKRQLSLASSEENKRHRELLMIPGTPENISHNKVVMRRKLK